jgi:tripartite-type tricarboxylate transporter receptor subunit TctC
VTVNPEEIARFYRGKTVTMIVSFAPGGGFDTIARIIARHMPNHIPGNPNFVVENMDGAGSLIGANHLYNIAKPDGLTFGTFNEVQVINQLTNMDGVQFDARKYGWLGSVQQASTTCTIRSDSPYNTHQDLKRRDLPPLVFGGTAAGAATDDLPKMLDTVLGANVKLVSGYGGTAPIRLAVESREVDGLCWTWDSVRSTAQRWLDDKYVKAIVYQAPERDPRVEEYFPDAVRVEDLVDDPQSKAIIRAGMAPQAISKPFVTPPGLPPARLKALQEAFKATMEDPAFLAEMEQARQEVHPKTGDAALAVVNEILGLPPQLATRLAQIRS